MNRAENIANLESPAEGQIKGAASSAASSRPLWPLFVLFASLYFVQGIVEPTAGPPAQPIQNRLEDWGRTPTQIGIFLAFIGIPWSLKPLLGLVSDFLPIRGLRRLPYLVLSTSVAAGLFLWMSGLWPDSTNARLLAWLLLAVCVAISLTDVVVDALAVETGQPLGITGQLQAVQWGALSVAQMIGGVLAGFATERGLIGPLFVGCGLLSLLSLVVVLAVVREVRGARDPAENLRQAWRQLASSRRVVILVSVALYLFLWNFNPFSANVLQHYSTEVLGLSEQLFGNLYSLQGATQLVACIAYFLVCRRIPFPWLVHGSIACGVLSTLCYWPLHDARTAVVASLIFGLTYQTATLIQLDLAARIVPTQSAATLFALLMAVSNTGVTVAYWVGGWWYDGLTAQFGGDRHLAFDALVAIGAAFTAACWLLVPVLRWAGAYETR
jgi:Na+/melibiose symporter-like transporter